MHGPIGQAGKSPSQGCRTVAAETPEKPHVGDGGAADCQDGGASGLPSGVADCTDGGAFGPRTGSEDRLDGGTSGSRTGSAAPSKQRRRGYAGRLRTAATVLCALVLTPLTIWAGARIPGNGYYLSGTLVVIYALVPFLVSFEGRRPQARELAVVAVMAALAVAARAIFIWVPHFKPMAAIVMIAGMAFGPQTGFLVGALSVLASNFIFGQGPWTPWQMLGFGVAGLIAGLLTNCRIFPRSNLCWPQRLALAVAGFLTVLCLVGPILDTSTLFTMMSSVTPAAALAIYGAGLPVNAVHGAATFLTLLLVANPLLDQLARIRMKYGILDGSGEVCRG